ncbi:MAG: serine/threonine protein kinase [Pirellulales bacterium]|nr:serine/threonine protein kinase [Pirellulales bacterium]
MRAERSILEQAGLASGLLSEEQIDHAWHVLVESLPSADLSLEEITDEQLARQLVDLGHLNRWQAEQLSHGRTKFTLGPYRILDAIGRGGMGWVFKGEHVLLGRVEAIKVLPKKQTNRTSIASFCREIRAQAQLDHPSLVRLSYADTDGDTYFLVTEYVAGTDLRRLVRAHGALSQERAAALISQAAEALDYAHGQGLIHRDVKPGNLLINFEGRTKLTDLGLAIFSDEAASAESKPRHIVGTADFLAPEIIVTPSEVRPISDIYSLGCTIYYAVTGKVPYPSGDTADKLRRQLEQDPIPPQRLNPEVDDAFAAVIAAMMEKRPADRIATAAEVVERLAPWASGTSAMVHQGLGKLAEMQGQQVFLEASLADTVVATYEPTATPFLPAVVKKLVPIDSTSREDGHAARDNEKEPAEGLGRATTALVALAVIVAVTTVFLVLIN